MQITPNTFYTFGIRSLTAKAIQAGFIILLAIIGLVALAIAKGSGFFESFDALIGIAIGDWIFRIGMIAVAMIIVWQILSVWIDYTTTQIMVSDSALTLRKGFFTKTENSFPFRLISNVSHRQGILDQMLGVTTTIIEMTSDESDASHADNVILADMDRDFATALQDVLMDHANTQKMVVTPAVSSDKI